MRKIVPLLVVGFLVLSGLGAVAFPNENAKSETTNVNFSEPMVEDEIEFVSIVIDEANSYLLEDGKPMIPTYTESFTFPFGTTINDVTCELSDFQEKTLTKLIKPSPKHDLVSRQVVSKAIEEEPIDYGNEPYPNGYFDYDLGCGRTKDGLSVIVNIEIRPLKYYPNENLIEWANNAEITIHYEPPDNPLTFDDEYEFIILAPDEFSDELTPLVSHKISRGISTKFVSLDDIYDSVYFPEEGRDAQEQIKNFIKDAIENWGTTYVLLVGGSSKFPIRKSNIYVSGNDDTMVFVSDLYYADVYNETGDFCSWDSNDNDLFGEFNWGNEHNYDEVDLHPDVYIGRLAAVNSNEVTTCVDKIKQYEKAGQEAYKEDWFVDAVFIGGDTWPNDDNEIREGEYIQEKIEDIVPEFDWDYVWESNGRLGTWVPPYGSGDITNTINKGCGFLEWSGHGNLDVWASHRYNSEAWIPTPIGHHTNNNIKSLSNGDELPITIISACLVGRFNVDPDCFAWSFMLNDDGGAIAVLAATDSLYGASGYSTIQSTAGLIELSQFKSYKDNGATTFGELWAWGLENYITTRHMKLTNSYRYDYVTVEEWEPFGDPTLQIAEPSNPPEKPDTPEGPSTVKVGTEEDYRSFTTDPDEDDVYLLFDWGDGTTSGWIGPVPGGSIVTGKNAWFQSGSYTITVIAKDTHGKLSEISDGLTITVSRSRERTFDLVFQRFFEKHPNMFPLIQRILGL